MRLGGGLDDFPHASPLLPVSVGGLCRDMCSGWVLNFHRSHRQPCGEGGGCLKRTKYGRESAQGGTEEGVVQELGMLLPHGGVGRYPSLPSGARLVPHSF